MRNEKKWTRELFSNPNLDAEIKVVIWVVVDFMEHAKDTRTGLGDIEYNLSDLAARAGVSPEVFADRLEDMEAMQLVKLRTLDEHE